jgi:hypothetical protein
VRLLPKSKIRVPLRVVPIFVGQVFFPFSLFPFFSHPMSLLHVFTTNTYRHTRCHVCESCRFSPPFSFFPFAAARGPQRSSLDQTTTKSIQTKCIHTKPYRPNQTHPHTHGGLSVPCCRAPTALGEQILVREHILRTCQCVVLPHS